MLRENFTLDDRYHQKSGVIYISGIQALVRALLEQHHYDASNDLQTGGFISGYRGSPLGGLDQALWRIQSELSARNIQFQPAVNEELAATAVWGSQQVGLFPQASVDGVFGMWYGKAPGLDRACDAIRHANAAGTAPNGGVVLVVGDDHGCKSSTLPSHSELTLKDLGIPVLNPADVQDVLDFGLFGWALSRYTGCWSGLIALADTMDSSATVHIEPVRENFVRPVHEHDVYITTGRAALDQESLLHEVKLPLAVTFATANGINRIFGAQEGAQPGAAAAQLGIVTTGKAYLDVRQALAELGLADVAALANAGVRVLKLGMSWPLDETVIASFSRGLQTLLVVEEKRAFVETELKELLYGKPGPSIVGKRDENGQSLLSATGELSVASVAMALGRYLPAVPNRTYLEQLEAQFARLAPVTGQAKTDRLPMFCAGCPHNTSTKVPEGSRASAGIGCHYMAQWMDRETSTYTQMGGEGVNWTGQAPFTAEKHLFVNLGDGTYFHSGLLAIRQAVAAGVNITYKILYNDAVAMTGGQPVDGMLSVQEMVAQLAAEGVRHIEVVSDAPKALSGLTVKVSHRDDLDAIQRRFRELEGCTAIIYQQTCATELRRRRKRGLAEDPDVRVMINDAVCEGCGDCSVKSNCVAVAPLVTEFGIKRQINQTSCNKDYSCVNGFCPAFVLVKGSDLRKKQGLDIELAELRMRAPVPDFVAVGDVPVNMVVAGVGGTGVVTVSALLGTAAHLDGKAASTLDMTGLAQKGGAVFSHIRIASRNEDINGTRIAASKADLILACDLITGSSKDALTLLNKDSTLAVINTSVVPTAEFVLRQDADTHDQQRLSRLSAFTSRHELVDAARMTEQLLGDTATLNIFLLGYAYQQGLIPVSIEALERAMELNGVAVEANQKSFHFGRIAAWNPASLALDEQSMRSNAMDPEAGDGLDELIERRVRHLSEYQDGLLAQKYENLIRRVQIAEHRLQPDGEGLTTAIARSYAKLLAYKDEYEVARLYSDGRWQARLDGQFEGDYRLQYLLAPPALGTKKRRFGGWVRPLYRVLAKLKFVRGRWFDPFGYGAERKEERWMIVHFETVVSELLGGLTRQNLALAQKIAELPQSVKGFGHVKSAARVAWLDKEQLLLSEFHEPPAPVSIFDPNRSRGRNAA